MAKLFTLHARIDRIKPLIWRTFEYPGRYSLKRLHGLLQILFGWNDSHLHEFEIGGQLFTDLELMDPYDDRGELDESAKLETLVKKGLRFHYRYDFGDSWQVTLKVLEHRPLQSEDRPTCIDGQRAGPLDDCGGVNGYRELCEVLGRPAHPEYDSTRRWSGRWSPERFDLESINKKLARKFPPAKVKTPPQVLDAKIGVYSIARLSVRQQMGAALVERGGPMTLTELAQRLEEAGTELPAGVTSLKRAWRRMPPLRETLDGKLEVETYHPEFKDLLWDLERSQPRDPAPVKASAEPRVPDPTMRINWDLLRQALRHGCPPTLSRRRVLLLVLDSLGGKPKLGRVLELANLLLPRHFTPEVVELSLRGQNCMSLSNGELSYLIGHKDLVKARLCLLQWWYPLEATLRERSLWPERLERRKEEREQSYREVAQRFIKADKAILCHEFQSHRLWVALFRFPRCQEVVFSPDQTDELKSALSRLDLVVGLDAKRIYERLGVDCEGKSFVDITPPGLPAGSPPSHSKLLAALKTTVPVPWPRGESGQVLLDRARVLYAYYRFGVRQGQVLRTRRSFPEGVCVRWNLGLELPLYHALKFCVENDQRLRISVNPRDPLNPLEWETDFQPHELQRDFVRGRWLNSGREQVLRFEQIYSFSGDFDVPYTNFAFFL